MILQFNFPVFSNSTGMPGITVCEILNSSACRPFQILKLVEHLAFTS